MTFEGQIQCVKLDQKPQPISDLMDFRKYMIDSLLLVVDAFLGKRNGLSFWISMQVCESHLDKDLADMPQRTSTLATGGEGIRMIWSRICHPLWKPSCFEMQASFASDRGSASETDTPSTTRCESSLHCSDGNTNIFQSSFRT